MCLETRETSNRLRANSCVSKKNLESFIICVRLICKVVGLCDMIPATWDMTVVEISLVIQTLSSVLLQRPLLL